MTVPRDASLTPRTLAEVLDFRPADGTIRLHEQRVVILSAAAMGLLTRELIETLGHDAARHLLLRFGFADGYHDAVSLRDRSTWTDPIEGLRAGLALHRLEGLVHGELSSVSLDEGTGEFAASVVWKHSYVAEQHVHHFGTGDETVCWSLSGYLSGYASACLQREIYFRETACVGQGAPECLVVGRAAESWGGDLPALRADFQGEHLGREVERLRDSVREQLNDLDRRAQAVEIRERELNLLRERVAHMAAQQSFIAESAGMKQVLEYAARVAPLETTVLVQGDSGTGKEFIVKLIHDQSTRAGGPFISVNCAALTETLLESELFGHVRGAFTGAVRDKPGLFELAANGTLFLDEIGEVAPLVQAKLLRALQEREIRRVGGDRTIAVSARVVAATNRNLRAAVDAGSFREDLYFRLSAFVIEVPPLRERREDIPLLVHEFVQRTCVRMGKQVDGLSAEAMHTVMAYDWPGNVRELEHAIERAIIVASGSRIQPEDLPAEVTRPRRRTGANSLDLEEQERVTIMRALERYRGNRRQTAEALNISTVTLWRKMKHFNLND
jgi:DNA-binding NtrC family response regulator